MCVCETETGAPKPNYDSNGPIVPQCSLWHVDVRVREYDEYECALHTVQCHNSQVKAPYRHACTGAGVWEELCVRVHACGVVGTSLARRTLCVVRCMALCVETRLASHNTMHARMHQRREGRTAPNHEM